MEPRDIKHILRRDKTKIVINKATFTDGFTNNFQRFRVLFEGLVSLYPKSWKAAKKLVILLPPKSDKDITLYLVLTQKNSNMYVCTETPKFNSIFSDRVDNYTIHLGNNRMVATEKKEFFEVLDRLYLLKEKVIQE